MHDHGPKRHPVVPGRVVEADHFEKLRRLIPVHGTIAQLYPALGSQPYEIAHVRFIAVERVEVCPQRGVAPEFNHHDAYFANASGRFDIEAGAAKVRSLRLFVPQETTQKKQASCPAEIAQQLADALHRP